MDDTIEVRLVRSWDEHEIADLYRAGGWWKEEYDSSQIQYLIGGSFAFAVAADKKTGRAIGMGRVISDSISDGYIQDLVVLPEYRKSGVGSMILSALIKKCVESGHTWVALIAEPDTEKFYLPFGFRRMDGYVPMLYHGEQ